MYFKRGTFAHLRGAARRAVANLQLRDSLTVSAYRYRYVYAVLPQWGLSLAHQA